MKETILWYPGRVNFFCTARHFGTYAELFWPTVTIKTTPRTGCKWQLSIKMSHPVFIASQNEEQLHLTKNENAWTQIRTKLTFFCPKSPLLQWKAYDLYCSQPSGGAPHAWLHFEELSWHPFLCILSHCSKSWHLEVAKVKKLNVHLFIHLCLSKQFSSAGN